MARDQISSSLQSLLSGELLPQLPQWNLNWTLDEYQKEQARFYRQLLEYIRRLVATLTSTNIVTEIVTNPPVALNQLCGFCKTSSITFTGTDVLSSTVVNFDGVYPPGKYRIRYTGGAFSFVGGTPYQISRTSNGLGYYAFYDGVKQDFLNPNDETTYATDQECEDYYLALPLSALTTTFTTTIEGPIGVTLEDSNYSDNSVGSIGGPSWELQRMV